MATTFLQMFEIMLSNMDEIQPNGTISGDTTDEYEQKALRIATQVQNELMMESDLYSTHKITRNNIKPLIGEFDMKQHDTEDITYETTEVANAYYFEVDGPCTVYIEDYDGVWNTLVTEVIPSTVTSMTSYKGLLTPTVGATKTRIRFSGDYYYNYKNYALFSEKFADTDRIPDYKQWVKYEMPADFKSVDKITNVEYPVGYENNVDYKWEGYKNLYLHYEFFGTSRITYRPVPIPLTINTQELQVDDITATTVMPDMVGARILASENPDLANLYLDLSAEGKQNMLKKAPVASETVTDVY